MPTDLDRVSGGAQAMVGGQCPFALKIVLISDCTWELRPAWVSQGA